MKKILFRTLAGLPLLLTIVMCSQPHQEPSVGGASKDPQEKRTAYTIPHRSGWKTDHVEFYAKYGKQIDGSKRDCSRCHNSSNLPGTPKNISCAVKCHNPVSTPDGSNPGTPPVAEDSKVCLTCHEAKIARTRAHYPSAAGMCKTCHTAAPEHLTQKTKESVKTIVANDNCLTCHARVDNHANVHPAVSKSPRSCVGCHDSHGSDHRFFIKKNMEDLCMRCHDVVPEDPADAKSIHGIIKPDISAKSCTNCHNPHSSDLKALLNAEPKELCVSCHNREIKTTDASGAERIIPNIKHKISKNEGSVPHPGATNPAKCALCHTPHASKYDALLTMAYPTTPYAKYEDKTDKHPNTYELCFDCHDATTLKQDLSADDDAEATMFRNDTLGADGKVTRQNLHWVHVVNAAGSAEPENGRTCYTCHDPHGSPQAHGIKTAFKMKGKDVRIVYSATAKGGSCAFTCHSGTAPKSYTRQ